MNSKLGLCAVILLFTCIFSGDARAATASPSPALIGKQFRKLKAFPDHATPYQRVQRVLKKLVSLNPKRTPRYFRIALRKIRHPDLIRPSTLNMVPEVLQILRRSEMSSAEIRKADSELTRLFEAARAESEKLLSGASPTPTPPLRIVDATTQVQSRKRGVAMNALGAADFQALAPGVSWYYNWTISPGANVPPSDVPMTYYPMVWDESPASRTALSNYLATADPKPPVVLGINEPNLLGQAFITPQQTATLYSQIKVITDSYNIPLVAPQMALGSSTADSISAFDPIQNTMVTYDSMMPFLAAFAYYANASNTPVPAISIHVYGNLGELKYFVDLVHNTYGCDVWVTEYAYWSAPSATAARDHLIQATDYLERTPYVRGYAWFKERSPSNSTNLSLLADGQPGVLTTLGQNYVALPPHDGDIYYRVPGRLPAENYVTITSCNLRATTDSDGVFDLTMSGTPSANYNISVDAARTYTVQFRATGVGTITLSKNGNPLGSVATTLAGWQTVSMTVPLTAGVQTLRVTRTGSVSALNWIEFQ